MPYDWNIVMSRANKYISGELDMEPRTPSAGSTVWWAFSSLFSRNMRSKNFCDSLASLFLPATQALREAKRRHDCTCNLQQITLAMLLYHAEQGTLPPAYSVGNGKPLHSWRVLLLPYLGDESLAKLYGQIRLDEPWDSEHNRQFHTQCPAIYRCPTSEVCYSEGSMPLQPGETNYCVIRGDETPFGDGGTGKALSDFGPESGGMVLVAETRTSGNWMNPNFDVTFDEAKTGINGTLHPDTKAFTPSDTAIGSYHTGGANFGLRNGGVNFLSETIDPEVWERVITGKERVPW
jgi:hypothetical protein